MRHAAMTALQSAMILGGMLSFTLAGVELCLDRVRERYYIEVQPEHDRGVLKTVAWFAETVGYEMMPEWECPVEYLPGGALRHWLAEKEEISDSRTLQAV